MSTLFTAFSLLSAVVVGGHVVILAARRGTALNGAMIVVAAITAIYFAARSHGWSL